jgi:hypothetical protein
MISKNSSSAFAPACATTNFLTLFLTPLMLEVTLALWAPLAAQPKPAIALIDAADAAQWQTWARDTSWQILTAPAPASGSSSPSIDARVQALAAAVEAAIRSGAIDPAHVYLAGRGDATAAIFYAISRVPDLWAAGVAIGGSPKAAFDTNRIFGANFSLVPLLWLAAEDAKPMVDKLTAAKLKVEWQPLTPNTNPATVFQWLLTHARDPHPSPIDCETNSPTFGRCYWIQMTKFDAAERNDVLPSTRLPGGNGAALDVGNFTFKADDPGPGVLVSALPPKYDGPLKLNDRLLALDGKPLADAKAYLEMLEKVTEEKPVTITVQRGGKDRIRVETHITLPRRESGVTARVQAQYLPAERELQIVSRTVTEMRIMVPPEWAPGTLLWNGLALDSMKEPGCWLLSVEKELIRAARCQ